MSASQFSGVSTSLSRSFRSTRSASNSVISVRTSDQSYHSVGGGNQSSYLTPTGTGSFVSMHGDISAGVMQKIDFKPVMYAGGRENDETTNTDSTGQANGSFASPIGDAILPLALFILAYSVGRVLRHAKNKILAAKSECLN